MNPTHSLTRRDAIKTLGAGAALLGLGSLSNRSSAEETPAEKTQPFALPKLAYEFNALEPHIDARTMEIHYSKHHQSYITNANAALADHPEFRSWTAAQILRKLEDMPDKVRTAVRNNVGGHANHSFFWQVLAPGPASKPTGTLRLAIDDAFGSFDAFKTSFADVAMKRFGSGWAWLSVKTGTLVLHSTANQDSPLIENMQPVLGLDLWEHAYYLNYQNRRADYVNAFWNVVNWRQVEVNFASIKS